MKRFLAVLFLLFMIGTMSVSGAVSVTGDIRVTSNIFEGKGIISSFDVSEDEKVLICVNSKNSHMRYIMIFHSDGTLIRTFEFQTNGDVFARFDDSNNIALFETRNGYGMIINEQGEVICEFRDEKHELSAVSARMSCICQDVKYERNIGKNRITRYGDNTVRIFYEIESESRDFVIKWAVSSLFIWGFLIYAFVRHYSAQKKKNAQSFMQ